MSFFDRDFVSMRDFTRKEIEYIMDLAETMVPYAKGEKVKHPLDGKILGNLFFEPSTRTRMSFEAAMYELGGNVISVTGAASSSAAKGESVADTAKTVSCYTDIIAIRHPKEGAAYVTARNASVGMETVPSWRIFFLPSFCFSSSFFFRVMSPP